jgi:uncharacterized membrane protein
MQMHNDREATHSERTEYMGSSHYYEPSSFNQTFQQQASYPPLASYGPTSYSQKPFTGVPPLSDSRFAALLSYSGGWLTGLLFTLLGGQDRFMRFHALQSLVFFGTINLLDFGLFISMLSFAHHMHILLIPFILTFLFLNFIAFVCWIVVMVQAARGVYFRLPFIGDWVARRFDLNALPRW